MHARKTLALALSALLFASIANADERSFDLNIPSQNLNSALSSLAEQTGLQIVYESNVVAGYKSPAVSGSLTAEAALQRLLTGTGLNAKFLNENAIAISPPGQKTGTPAKPGDSNGTANDTGTDGGGRPPLSLSPGSFLDEDITSLEKMVVTGSHIRGASGAGSPVIVLSKEEIDRTGYTTVQDILKTVTANTGGGPSDEASQVGLDQGTNFNAGSSINLRGLGASATLVLVNGRRQAGGGLEGRFTDISSIPATAIERIEILTDGASAIYGSDAVGGVVNIILRNDFAGAETRLRIGSASGGGDEQLFSQLVGTAWGTGNAMLAYQYSKREALQHSERDYAANSDKRPLGGSNFSNAFSNPGNIINPTTGLPAYAIPRGQDGKSLTPAQLLPGVVNYQNNFEGVDILPEQETNSIFAAASQEVGERVKLNGELRYSNRRMERLNPARAQTIRVPSTNPFFVDPFGGSRNILVGYSFIDDLGPRPTVSETRTLSGSFGATVGLGAGWELDAYATYGQEKIRWESRNLISSADLNAALADRNPATAFNPFGDGSFNNPTTLNNLRMTQFEKAETRAWSTNVTAQGAIADLPGGELMMAVGGDFREERSDRISYIKRRTGVIKEDPAPLSRDVSAGFVEFQVPIVGANNQRAGLHRLSLSLAGRYEDYSDFGSTFNPKVGFSWLPVESVQIRGTYGTSFRAPNLRDLDEESPLSPTQGQLLIVQDPKSPTGTSKIVAVFGNNSELQEETATTWTAGIDFTPSSLPGFRTSLTYFDVEFEDRIERGGPASGPFDIFKEEDRWAPIITRNPDPTALAAICSTPGFVGSLTDCLSAPLPAIVDARIRNLGSVEVQGFDVSAQYTWPTTFGDWGAGVTATKLLSFDQAVTSTAPSFDLVDTLNGPLSLRLRGDTYWSYRGFTSSIAINYQNSYTDHRSTPQRNIDSYTSVDLRFAYRTGGGERFDDTEIALSVINAFDKDPPFVNTIYGYDQSNNDPLGRVISLQLTKTW